MSERLPISKKTRFEVFKRDGFICQYCGGKPPEVILEVDHIIAVAAGGDNDIDNLITSCFPCNRGKGARDLNVAPLTVAEKAEIIAEKEEQLRAYNALLDERRDRIDRDVWRVIDELLGVDETTRRNYQGVKMFVERLGVHECLEAAEIAATKHYGTTVRFKYFCGICWRKIREAGDG